MSGTGPVFAARFTAAAIGQKQIVRQANLDYSVAAGARPEMKSNSIGGKVYACGNVLQQQGCPA